MREFASKELELGRLRAFGLSMRVWWSRDRLTRQLAGGAMAIDSRELALRAGQITARQTREVVASAIDELLEAAGRATAVLSSRAPLDRTRIRAARPLLLDLSTRLRSAEPVRPEGMARALLLLTDAEQPLYGLGAEGELCHAIIEARQRLDSPVAEDAA